MSHSTSDDVVDFETLEKNIPSRPTGDLLLHGGLTLMLVLYMVNLLIASVGQDNFPVLVWLALALNGVNISINFKRVKSHFVIRKLYIDVLAHYIAVDRSAHERLQQSLNPWSLRFWRDVKEWLAQERQALNERAEALQRLTRHQEVDAQ